MIPSNPMPIVKWIAALVLCLSIAVAGFPAQAKTACAMAQGERAQPAGSAHPRGLMDCHKSSEQNPAKGCCCEDMACAAKCSTLSGGASMDLPRTGGMTSRPEEQARLARLNAAPPTAIPPNNQERPPRFLALG